jgi:hypothetical protein
LSHDSDTSADSWRQLSPAETVTTQGTLCDYFGVDPATFAAHRWWTRPSTGSLWIADAAVGATPFGRTQSFGIRVRRRRQAVTQVSNAFMRRFLATASAHVIDLEAAAISGFFAGDAQPYTAANGVYVVRAEDPVIGGVLGRGRVLGDVLHSELSKNERGPLS